MIGGNVLVRRASSGGNCRSGEPWLKGIKSVVAGSIDAGDRLYRDREVTGPDSFTSANGKPAGGGSVGKGGRKIAIAGAA